MQTIEENIPLLPRNPRRLKLLARTVAALGPEARRHEPEELDWATILIFHMLRIESEEFTRLIIKKIFNEREFSWTRWALSEANEQREEEERFNQFVNSFFPASMEQKRARVKELISAWRSKRAFYAGERLLYQLSFAERPQHITWGEFKIAFSRWRESKQRRIFDEFIQQQARRLDSPIAAVAAELLDAVIGYYGATLEGASELVSADDHATTIESAYDALTLCGVLVFEGVAGISPVVLQTPEAFKRLFGISMQWTHFRANEGEQQLREGEKRLLLDCCTTWSNSLELFAITEPWKWDRDNLQDRPARLRRSLMTCIEGVLWPKVVNEALALFEKPRGVQSTRAQDKNDVLQFALCSPASELYIPENQVRLRALLSRASVEPVLHHNAKEYLELLLAALEHAGRYCRREERVAFFVSNPELTQAIWNATTARRFQYRFLSELRAYRQKLVDCGVPEDKLVVPDWLTYEYLGE